MIPQKYEDLVKLMGCRWDEFLKFCDEVSVKNLDYRILIKLLSCESTNAYCGVRIILDKMPATCFSKYRLIKLFNTDALALVESSCVRDLLMKHFMHDLDYQILFKFLRCANADLHNNIYVLLSEMSVTCFDYETLLNFWRDTNPNLRYIAERLLQKHFSKAFEKDCTKLTKLETIMLRKNKRLMSKGRCPDSTKLSAKEVLSKFS